MAFTVPPLLSSGAIVGASYMNTYLRDNLLHLRSNAVYLQTGPLAEPNYKALSVPVQLSASTPVAWVCGVGDSSMLLAWTTPGPNSYVTPLWGGNPAVPRFVGPSGRAAVTSLHLVTLGPLNGIHYVGFCLEGSQPYSGEVFVVGDIRTTAEGVFLPTSLTPPAPQAALSLGVPSRSAGSGSAIVRIPPSDINTVYRFTFTSAAAGTYSIGFGFGTPPPKWDWQRVVASGTSVIGSRVNTAFPIDGVTGFVVCRGVILRTGSGDVAVVSAASNDLNNNLPTLYRLAGYRPYAGGGETVFCVAGSGSYSGALTTCEVEVIR